MMHKAWCCLGAVPYSFSRSSVKLQRHTTQKLFNFDPNLAFLDCNSSLNSPMATKWCIKLEVTKKRWFSRSSIKFQGHTGQKIAYFDRNWVFLDCKFGLNSPMAIKWRIRLEETSNWCPVVFQDHPLNFKVTPAINRWFWPELSVSGL